MTNSPTPVAPTESQAHQLGWMLTAGSAIVLGCLVGFFPRSNGGMFAGYDAIGICILVGVAATALRCDLPRGPSITVLLLSGVGLILLGLLMDVSTLTEAADLTAGALIIVGALLQASPEGD